MIDYLSLPSVALSEYRQLPQVKGVYFVVSGDCLLYVGKAESGFRSRWTRHHRHAQFNEHDDVRIHYHVCADGIKELEDRLIDELIPPLNGKRCEWMIKSGRAKSSITLELTATVLQDFQEVADYLGVPISKLLRDTLERHHQSFDFSMLLSRVRNSPIHEEDLELIESEASA
jgi:hypothetical protein